MVAHHPTKPVAGNPSNDPVLTWRLFRVGSRKSLHLNEYCCIICRMLADVAPQPSVTDNLTVVLIAGVCCLLVVAVIVAVLMIVLRRRR